MSYEHALTLSGDLASVVCSSGLAWNRKEKAKDISSFVELTGRKQEDKTCHLMRQSILYVNRACLRKQAIVSLLATFSWSNCL